MCSFLRGIPRWKRVELARFDVDERCATYPGLLIITIYLSLLCKVYTCAHKAIKSVRFGPLQRWLQSAHRTDNWSTLIQIKTFKSHSTLAIDHMHRGLPHNRVRKFGYQGLLHENLVFRASSLLTFPQQKELLNFFLGSRKDY